MDSDTNVITGYYKDLFVENTKDKNKVMRAFFQYVLGRNPSYKDYAMLFKLIKDFGYEIIFDVFVDLRYSDVDFNDKFWGLVIWKCKDIMKKGIDHSIPDLKDVLKDFTITDKIKRKEILSGFPEFGKQS